MKVVTLTDKTLTDAVDGAIESSKHFKYLNYLYSDVLKEIEHYYWGV